MSPVHPRNHPERLPARLRRIGARHARAARRAFSPTGSVEHLEDRRLLSTLTWVGDLATNGWADGTDAVDTNWDTDALPNDGDTLIFPAGAGQTANVNNTTVGNRYALQFTGGGYAITGNAIDLGTFSIVDSAADADNTLSTALVAPNGLTVSVASAGHTLTLDSQFTITGGSAKDGDGTLALNGLMVATSGWSITAGVLNVGPTIELGDVTLDGGTLGGTGVVGNVTAPVGGTIAPGDSPGLLNVGSLTLDGSVTVDEEIDGPNAGSDYDRIRASGDVDLAGAHLNVTLGFAPAPGTVFRIIDNTGTNPVAGTFAGLPNGAVLTIGATTLLIRYDAGDGNDVELRTLGNPTANPDLYALPAGAVFTINQPSLGVLANDTAPNGLPLQAILVTPPEHGTLELNGDGTLNYTPAVGYSGPDGFTYIAADAGAQSLPTTVSLVINAVAKPPVSTDDDYSLDEDTTLAPSAPGVLQNDYSPAGKTLGAVLVVAPVHAQSFTLLDDGSFEYVPQANYNGPDSFQYRASDGSLAGELATVRITINPVPDLPTAVDDAFSTAEDSTLIVAGPGVVANDANPDGGAITATVVTGPQNGSITLSSDGSFVYTPAPNFSGEDSFTYIAVHGSALGPAAATVIITVTPVNDPPVANDDAAATRRGTPVVVDLLANDSDVDGPALSVVLAGAPQHGSVELNGDGTVTYTPIDGYTGPDSFSYRASDGTSTSDLATVQITVEPVNSAPTSADDAFSTWQGVPLEIAAPGVLGNDVDAEKDVLSAFLITGPEHGKITLSSNGAFVYTPNPGFQGPDTFTYLTSDGQLLSEIATVTITVGPAPTAPKATDDAFTALEDITLSIPNPGLLLNDLDPDGFGPTITVFDGPRHGSLEVQPDGSFTYLADHDYNGLDSFKYFLTSNGLNSNAATVTLTVAPVADTPIGQSETYSVNEDATLKVGGPGVLLNDTNVDGGPLRAVLVDAPTAGTIELQSDGSFTYTPDPGFNGPDTFAYIPASASLYGEPTTVTINVRPRNHAPTSGADVYATDQSLRLTVAAPGILGNDADADAGTVLQASLVNTPQNGVLELVTDGSFAYTPNPLFSGVDSLTYRATDGKTFGPLTTVTINVRKIADVVASLDPASDTGYSSSDRITRDASPAFVGRAQPGLTVTLLAHLRGSDDAPVVVAIDTADPAGNFRLTSQKLADGLYDFSVAGSRADGLPAGTYSAGSLTIDTIAPQVADAVIVPLSGRIQITFQDDRGGLDLASLTNAANYRFARRIYPVPNDTGFRSIDLLPGVSSTSKRTVVFRVTPGTVPPGRYLFAALANGIVDAAGNPLAGRLGGTLPTDPNAGSDFVALFRVRNGKPSQALPTTLAFPIVKAPTPKVRKASLAVTHGSSTPSGPRSVHQASLRHKSI